MNGDPGCCISFCKVASTHERVLKFELRNHSLYKRKAEVCHNVQYTIQNFLNVLQNQNAMYSDIFTFSLPSYVSYMWGQGNSSSMEVKLLYEYTP